MIFILFCLLTLNCPADASSSRTVKLSDGEMAPIYVEPGFSTLLKFNSHPEPGLIGDQDGFKVEYTRNIVAIKPLVGRGKTNLFIFTKDGQFNFQLVAGRGQHDNVVYVETRADPLNGRISTERIAMPLDRLFNRKVNRSTTLKTFRLIVDSVSLPQSRSTLVLRFSLQEQKGKDAFAKVGTEAFSVSHGSKPIKVENIYLDSKMLGAAVHQVSGLILIRAADMNRTDGLTLIYKGTVGSLQVNLPQALLRP